MTTQTKVLLVFPNLSSKCQYVEFEKRFMNYTIEPLLLQFTGMIASIHWNGSQ